MRQLQRAGAEYWVDVPGSELQVLVKTPSYSEIMRASELRGRLSGGEGEEIQKDPLDEFLALFFRQLRAVEDPSKTIPCNANNAAANCIVVPLLVIGTEFSVSNGTEKNWSTPPSKPSAMTASET